MLNLELDALVPGLPPHGRRAFMKTALGSMFAAAVLPVSAQTIETDTQGLDVGEAMLDGFDHAKVPVYHAKPAGAKHLPTMLVVSEIFGVHQHIADICRRFAKLGYLALAPDLFVRQGDPGNYGTVAEIQREVISKVPDGQVMRDLDTAAAWAATQGGDPARLGITGFCWGGRIVWLYDAHNPAIKAAVAWYGRLVGASSALQPSQPIDILNDLHGPVLGLYGGQDTSIPQDTIARAKAVLANGPAAARESQFVVYPDAPHAFFADYRPSYRENDAKDGWQRCLTWFREHGVA